MLRHQLAPPERDSRVSAQEQEKLWGFLGLCETQTPEFPLSSGFSLNLLSDGGPWTCTVTCSHAGGTLCCGRTRLFFVSLCGDALVLATRSHVGPSPPGGFHRSATTLRRPPIQQAERHDEENGSRDDDRGAGEEDVEVLARLVNQSSCNSKIIMSSANSSLHIVSSTLYSPFKQPMRTSSQMQEMVPFDGIISGEFNWRLIPLRSEGF